MNSERPLTPDEVFAIVDKAKRPLTKPERRRRARLLKRDLRHPAGNPQPPASYERNAHGERVYVVRFPKPVKEYVAPQTSECRCGKVFGGRTTREAITKRRDHEKETGHARRRVGPRR